jgi:hypothetical protein
MDFYEVLDQVLALLCSRGRVIYGALKRQFNLDDSFLDDVKADRGLSCTCASASTPGRWWCVPLATTCTWTTPPWGDHAPGGTYGAAGHPRDDPPHRYYLATGGGRGAALRVSTDLKHYPSSVILLGYALRSIPPVYHREPKVYNTL